MERNVLHTEGVASIGKCFVGAEALPDVFVSTVMPS